jgi:hypothetical protein
MIARVVRGTGLATVTGQCGPAGEVSGAEGAGAAGNRVVLGCSRGEVPIPVFDVPDGRIHDSIEALLAQKSPQIPDQP